MSGDRFPGSDVTDAMRALWARQARDDAWHRQQEELRKAEHRAAKEAVLAEQARLYRSGQARRRRR